MRGFEHDSGVFAWEMRSARRPPEHQEPPVVPYLLGQDLA